VSTEIISRYFEGTGTTVTSIDYSNPGSKDAEIAEERLSDIDNVNLLYGDSREILPDLVTGSDQKQTAVLIDGPKNDAALKLAIDLLENTGVQMVGVHDLDKDRLHR
jgi:precorrin-6B methylase 2